MTQKEYNFVKDNPVARFYYKGNHSHPVNRTVLIIQSTPSCYVGYELREGKIVRNFKKAPVKTYRKDRIAKVAQLDKRRILSKTCDNKDKSTLIRTSLRDLVKSGA